MIDEFRFCQIVPRETVERLKIYVDLLIKWQARFNLVSRGTIPRVWERHIYDSYQLIKFIPNKKLHITDLGSGAGFPGLVLAMCGYQNVTLVEANGKKVAFLREVARQTSTVVNIQHTRIENATLQIVDVFVARALAPLNELFFLVAPFTTAQTSCIFLKGQAIDAELRVAEKNWEFEYQKVPSVTDKRGSVLFIQQLRKRL